MRNTSIIALASAALLGITASARAQYVNGDLLIGFDGGSSDFIYDLGQYSSLTLGKTWNVGSSLGTHFGIVGAETTGKYIYSTSADSAENGFSPTALFNTASSNVRTLAGSLTAGTSRTTTSSDTTGWTYQTDQAPGTPGNTFFNNFFNPNVPVGSTAYLFANANAGGVTPNQFFTYDSVSGTLTFAPAVPEPSSYSLLLAAGVMVVSRRRWFSRSA